MNLSEGFKEAWKDARNLSDDDLIIQEEYNIDDKISIIEFDGCPCSFIEDGDIECCTKCPYVSEEENNIKDDKDKPRLSLVPPQAIEAIGIIRTYGNKKYKEDSYRQVEPQRYLDALMRHLVEYMKDHNSVDEESGYKHLWHMACNVAILCELEEVK